LSTVAAVIEAPYVRVAVALPLSRLFTYQVPAGMRLAVGHAVRVPFGRRTLSGYVIEGCHEPEVAHTRPILGLIDEHPAIDPDRIRFCQWAADYYMAGLGEMIATALPSSYRAKSRRLYYPTPTGIERIGDAGEDSTEELQLLREIILVPGRTAAGLTRRLHGEIERKKVKTLLASLLRREQILAEDVETSRNTGKVQTIQLHEKTDPPPRGRRMRSIILRLQESGGQIDLSELVQLEGSSSYAAIRRLEEKGWVSRAEREDRRAVLGASEASLQAPLELNEEQASAVATIVEAERGTILLCGVTGSGKTEVYLQAVAARIEAGKQALVLVPEIALTPQLTSRFVSRFGRGIAVLHSGLTGSERLREWRRIRAGEARIAIGARSALFAPFANLGLIIVDEEHDDSYKQDEGVRYHARDLAVLRGALESCPVVLGSATPSMESWWNARQERYTRIELPNRATPAPLPKIELLDTRETKRGELLHPKTRAVLEKALASKGKAIVLYNRRGYAPVVECPGCGAHFQCPSCGIGMVLHRQQRRLTCHHCGLHRDFRSDCLECGSTFEIMGHGTERVEEVLAAEFPHATLFRMDADTTSRRGSHEEILQRFRNSQSGILVGTQVVAKGHDFPDIEAAVVLGVDHVLHMPDFRSAERTFSLVTQLAGRAGRSARGGKVVVQTRHPDHFVFRLLRQGHGLNTVDAFMEAGLRLRQALGHPPVHRLVLVKIEGSHRAKAFDRAAALSRDLRAAAGKAAIEIGIAGPVSAPMARLVGRWRFQVVIRGPRSPQFRDWFSGQAELLAGAHGRGARVVVDVDPRSLL
jgi:primosomal protein N' (replication factor Y)